MSARRIAGVSLITFCAIVLAVIFIPRLVSVQKSDYSQYVQTAPEDTSFSFPEIDWDSLRAENEDVVGWIRVVGTEIDYPIVQAPDDDPDYYLTHGLNRSWNVYGCPYVASDYDGFSGCFAVIYGHNMDDGSMFAAFADYKDQAFLDEHREILIMTPDENMRLSVTSAREVNANQETQPLIGEKSKVYPLVREERDNADAVGIEPVFCSRAFEFVSCSYGYRNGRIAVMAINEEDLGTVVN